MMHTYNPTNVCTRHYEHQHSLLADVCDIITKRSRPRRLDDDMQSFGCIYNPNISLESYVDRIYTYLECEESTIRIAWHLLQKVIHIRKIPITPLTHHRLVLAVFVVAIKMNEDMLKPQWYYAEVGGVHARDLLALEADLCICLDWKIWVHPDDLGYGRFCDQKWYT